jgi:hypothetical protein
MSLNLNLYLVTFWSVRSLQHKTKRCNNLHVHNLNRCIPLSYQRSSKNVATWFDIAYETSKITINPLTAKIWGVDPLRLALTCDKSSSKKAHRSTHPFPHKFGPQSGAMKEDWSGGSRKSKEGNIEEGTLRWNHGWTNYEIEQHKEDYALR